MGNFSTSKKRGFANPVAGILATKTGEVGFVVASTLERLQPIDVETQTAIPGTTLNIKYDEL
jgi:hypothetical protein